MDGAPPVIMQVEGEDTSDRPAWKEALTTLGTRKFTTTEKHLAEFGDAVSSIRAEAVDRATDRAPLGVPSFDVFLDMLARIADHTKPGPNDIPGVAWRHTPHFLKLELYRHFVERIKDVNWTLPTMDKWNDFELLGVSKTAVPKDFGDFRWLGILDQVFKGYYPLCTA